jgi:hypothetical protein
MNLGLICILGSGETLASSGKTHEYVTQRLPENPKVVILETPAGFEPNSADVAAKIKTFLERRLQNYNPQIDVLPARKKGTPFSPDTPEIVAPILTADEILLGPGSPSYGAKQLRDTLAIEMIKARHRLGGTLFLSSSSTLAFSKYTMPVYEIYKVGDDLHWKEGVNFFEPFGWSISIIPHWDNNDGGDTVDTSRCYVGQDRFAALRQLLPAGQTIIGLDEHTSVVFDFEQGNCHVLGNKGVVIIRDDDLVAFNSGDTFPFAVLGTWQEPDNSDISAEIWQQALDAQANAEAEKSAVDLPSSAVIALAQARDAARDAKNWARSDQLRDEIAALGWQIKDTKAGSELVRP